MDEQNPYPKDTLLHQVWEFGRANRELGKAFRSAFEPLVLLHIRFVKGIVEKSPKR